MLYGAVNVSQPKAPEFFKEVTEGLKGMQILDEAKKEEVKNAPNPANISYADMWDSHAKAFEKAANQLLEQKDELMKTEEGRIKYQRGIDDIAFGIEEAKAYYEKTNPILQENLSYARGKKNESWIQMGKHDSHNEGHYVDLMAGLDSDSFQVKFDDSGRLILDDGKGGGWRSVNDPSIMRENIFDADLVLDDVRDPGFYFTTQVQGKNFESATQASEALEAIASIDDRVKIDVARWFVNSEIEDSDNRAVVEDLKKQFGEDAYESLLSMPGIMGEAIKAWADKGAERWTKKKEKSSGRQSRPTEEDKARTAFQENMENLSVTNEGTVVAQVPGGISIPVTNTSFQEDYRVTDDAGNVTSAINNVDLNGFVLTEDGRLAIRLNAQGDAGYQVLERGSEDYNTISQEIQGALGMTLDEIREKMQKQKGDDIVGSYIVEGQQEQTQADPAPRENSVFDFDEEFPDGSGLMGDY